MIEGRAGDEMHQPAEVIPRMLPLPTACFYWLFLPGERVTALTKLTGAIVKITKHFCLCQFGISIDAISTLINMKFRFTREN
jgi:hypothetical protein